MRAIGKKLRRRRRPIGLAAGLVALVGVLVFAIGAMTASLPGSVFEIDGPQPGRTFGSTPGTVARLGQRRGDATGGSADGSAGRLVQGGVKEDTACPGEVTGSIPNNKSDLKNFGAYVESESDGPGFLNLYWLRVNNPSGTTLMDFELNHSSTTLREWPERGPHARRLADRVCDRTAAGQSVPQPGCDRPRPRRQDSSTPGGRR